MADLIVLIPLAITHLTESKLEGEGNWQWALHGGTIDLSVTAEGTPPLSYQWTKDGEAITGATGPGMTLANLEPDNAGEYTVKVSNATERARASATSCSSPSAPALPSIALASCATNCSNAPTDAFIRPNGKAATWW